MRIEQLYEYDGGDEPICILARGHYEQTDFQATVKRELDKNIPLDKIRQGYFRIVPVGKGGESIYHDSTKGRGAFPVTYIEFI